MRHSSPLRAASLRLAVSVVSAVLSCTAAGAQATIYVDAAAANSGNGQSWATAYNDLATAIGAANSGDEIWVTRGTYPTGGQSFALGDGVGLYGGFIGGEQRKDQRVVGLFPTVLDGGGKDRVLQLGSAAPATTVLDGLTITGGYAKDGAGVHTYGGSPTLNQVVFSKNVAMDQPTSRRPQASGGGFYTYQGAPKLTDCRFEENTALTNGGGFYTYQGAAELVRCRFVKNSCFDNISTTSADVNGGGCYTYNGPVKLIGCEFTGNTVAYGTSAIFGDADGGGFFSYEANFTLEESTFADNQAQSDGGAIYSYRGMRTLRGCSFIGNKAVNGAGIWCYREQATLHGCEFRGNIASTGAGGGFYNYEGNHVLASCLFAENRAAQGNGGGVYTYTDSNSPVGTMSLAGCTFAGNVANGAGGLHVGNGAPVVVGCIFWNNGTGLSGAPSVTYSIVQGGYTGTGNLTGDPRFRAPASGDYQLAAGSPAIDAGDNAGFGAGHDADALCNPRFLDDPKVADTGNGTAPLVDIGAYEYTGVEAGMGTGDDFRMWTGVNAPPKRGTARLVKANDTINVRIESPGATFSGGVLWLMVEAFASGNAPLPVPFLPGLAVSTTALFIPAGSFQPGGFNQGLVVPGGAPGVSVLLQAAVGSTKAKNNQYAVSNAVEFRF